MKTNDVDRTSHAGKTFKEKEAYRRFLATQSDMDKTEPAQINTAKTDESSQDEEAPSLVQKVKERSSVLKIKDFLKNNWVIGISTTLIGALIIYMFSFVYDVKINQAIHTEKISNLEKDNNENKNLRQKFEIFKTEVAKDLEYIKKKFH